MSPPLTEASKTYGFFCSNPAARGETATIAKISLILPNLFSAFSNAPSLFFNVISFVIYFGMSSAYTSNSARNP